MRYQCKHCECIFDISIINSKEDIGYALCPLCGGHALTDESEQVDYTCICCNKIMKVSLKTHDKISGKPCLACRSILANKE